MAALTGPRDTKKQGDEVIPQLMYLPLAAGQKIYSGALAALSGGFLVNATGTVGLICVGKAEIPVAANANTVDNTAGANGALSMHVRLGCFKFANSAAADLITAASIGAPAYIVDNQTVALTNGGATRSIAGTIFQVDSDGVWVLIEPPGTAFATAAPVQAGTSRTARLVASVALAAYTNVAGVLTANANGVLATIDGVAPAIGDRVLLAAGAAGADNGIYTVTALGGAAAKWVFTLAPDYATGTAVTNIVTEISEGTAFAATSWKLMTIGPITVGTTATTFLPRVVKGSIALVAGSVTVATLYVGAAAAVSATDTTSAAAVKAALTAGAGTGSIALAGTGTDVISYAVFNWLAAPNNSRARRLPNGARAHQSTAHLKATPDLTVAAIGQVRPPCRSPTQTSS